MREPVAYLPAWLDEHSFLDVASSMFALLGEPLRLTSRRGEVDRKRVPSQWESASRAVTETRWSCGTRTLLLSSDVDCEENGNHYQLLLSGEIQGLPGGVDIVFPPTTEHLERYEIAGPPDAAREVERALFQAVRDARLKKVDWVAHPSLPDEWLRLARSVDLAAPRYERIVPSSLTMVAESGPSPFGIVSSRLQPNALLPLGPLPRTAPSALALGVWRGESSAQVFALADLCEAVTGVAPTTIPELDVTRRRVKGGLLEVGEHEVEERIRRHRMGDWIVRESRYATEAALRDYERRGITKADLGPYSWDWAVQAIGGGDAAAFLHCENLNPPLLYGYVLGTSTVRIVQTLGEHLRDLGWVSARVSRL